MKAPSLTEMTKCPATAGEAVASPDLRAAPSVKDSLIATHQEADAPASQPLQRAKQRPPSWDLAQVIVRMHKDKRRRLHQVALSLDKTAQDVLLEALDAYLVAHGLRRLD